MDSIGDEDYQKHMASIVAGGFALDPPGYERLSQWTHVLLHIVKPARIFNGCWIQQPASSPKPDVKETAMARFASHATPSRS